MNDRTSTSWDPTKAPALRITTAEQVRRLVEMADQFEIMTDEAHRWLCYLSGDTDAFPAEYRRKPVSSYAAHPSNDRQVA